MTSVDDKHKKMIEQIHSALVGDDYNEEGLIKKVNRIEKKVDKHDMIIGIVIGVFTVVSFAIAFGDKVISIFGS